MRRLLLAVFTVSSTAALAQPMHWDDEPASFPFSFSTMPRGAGVRPQLRGPQIATEVHGWTFSGAGYELTADPEARSQVALIRSLPLRARPGPAALLHREPAAPWRGVKVVLRAELRAGMVDGAATLVLRAEDAAGTVLAAAPVTPIQGTTLFGWQRAELLVPEGAERVVLGVQLQGGGAIFLRELHVDDAELLASR